VNIVVGIRSIADKNELALEKYRRFIDRVWDKPGFWTMSRRSKPAMSRMLDYLSSTRLKNYLNPGFDGYVTILNRLSDPPNSTRGDDSVYLRFKTEDLPEVKKLCSTLALYASSFNAYQAFVTTEDLYRANPIVERRSTIKFIHPITFWSKQFCTSALKLTPHQIGDAIGDHVTHCTVRKSYITFAANCEFDDLASTKRLTRAILASLKASRTK
jgi:hypothetical protein